MQIEAANFSTMIKKISDGTISGKIAKEVLETIWETGEDVLKLLMGKACNRSQMQSELEKIVDKILADNTSQVDAYKSGKDKLFGFFVGQVMKATQGKANPGLVNELLKKKLS